MESMRRRCCPSLSPLKLLLAVICIILFIAVAVVVVIVFFRNKLQNEKCDSDCQLQTDGPLFEGDIKAAGKDLEWQREANRRWPNGRVPYYWDPNAAFTEAEKRHVEIQMKKIESATCVRFHAVSAVIGLNDVYLTFTRGIETCWSHVGRTVPRGGQTLALRADCLPQALHLLLHALGLWHEHTRSDRGRHVRVMMENVKPDQRNSFEAWTRPGRDHLWTPYDYSSLMHFNSTAMSRNGNATIVPLRESATIGQLEALSSIDVYKLNRLYHCSGRHGCYPANPWRHYNSKFVLGGQFQPEIRSADDCKSVCRFSSSCFALDWHTDTFRCYFHGTTRGARLHRVTSQHYVKRMSSGRCYDPVSALPSLEKLEPSVKPHRQSVDTPTRLPVNKILHDRCSDMLISGTNGVPDSALSASSYSSIHPPSEARLNSVERLRGNTPVFGGGWQPLHSNAHQYIQVLFPKIKIIRMVVLRGRHTIGLYKDRVMSYFLSFTRDGHRWHRIKENNALKIFEGSKRPEDLSLTSLPTDFRALGIRLHPLSWYPFIGLRFDLIGC